MDLAEFSFDDGLNIVVARRRAGLKQYELAQRLGISPTILCDMEHNRRQVTPELAARIARALRVADAPMAPRRQPVGAETDGKTERGGSA